MVCLSRSSGHRLPGGCRTGFCQVWPKAIPEGREALLTGSGRHPSLTGRVRGDVPLHPLPSGERLFLISPPMKPRLGPVALVPSLAVRVLASSRGRPNEAVKKRHGQLGKLNDRTLVPARPAPGGIRK
jgi:hypothetical protein